MNLIIQSLDLTYSLHFIFSCLFSYMLYPLLSTLKHSFNDIYLQIFFFL